MTQLVLNKAASMPAEVWGEPCGGEQSTGGVQPQHQVAPLQSEQPAFQLHLLTSSYYREEEVGGGSLLHHQHPPWSDSSIKILPNS